MAASQTPKRSALRVISWDPRKGMLGVRMQQTSALGWFSILALCPVHGAICLSLKPPPPASGTLVVTDSPHLPPPCGPAPKC